MKKILLSGAIAVLGLTAWATGASAISTETEVEVTVTDELSISSDGKVTISVLPTSGGVQETGVDHVRVTTNDDDGYTLTIKDKDATTGLTSSTTTDVITASTGDKSTPVVLATNTWGWRTGDIAPNKFIGVSTSDVEIKSTAAAAAAGDVTEVTYGVNVSTATDPGVYTDVVIYTAVNN